MLRRLTITVLAVLATIGGVVSPAAAADTTLVSSIQARWSELDGVSARCFVVTDRSDLDGRPPVLVTGARGAACKAVRDLTEQNTRPIGAKKTSEGWRVWLTAPKKCAVEWNGRCVSYTDDPA